jgi:hypothetical protein
MSKISIIYRSGEVSVRDCGTCSPSEADREWAEVKAHPDVIMAAYIDDQNGVTRRLFAAYNTEGRAR